VKLRASPLFASVFGIGYFDFAPGTIMSAWRSRPPSGIGLHGGAQWMLVPDHRAGDRNPAWADHVPRNGRQIRRECVIRRAAGQWLACAFAMLTFNA